MKEGNKDSFVIVRIPKKFKAMLIQDAKAEGMKLSKYIRKLLKIDD